MAFSSMVQPSCWWVFRFSLLEKQKSFIIIWMVHFLWFASRQTHTLFVSQLGDLTYQHILYLANFDSQCDWFTPHFYCLIHYNYRHKNHHCTFEDRFKKKSIARYSRLWPSLITNLKTSKNCGASNQMARINCIIPNITSKSNRQVSKHSTRCKL